MEKKKVICISGNKTKLYEKVIFIMKEEYIKSNKTKKIDFVKEAENIINLYKNKYDNTINEKYSKLNYSKLNKEEKIINKKNNANIIFYIVTFYFYLFISLLLYTKL